MIAMKRSLVRMAAEAYAGNDYEAAMFLYGKVGEVIGERHVRANMILCARRMKRNKEKSLENILAIPPDTASQQLDEAALAALATQTETQFDRFFEKDIRASQKLLLRSFRLDPSLIRGRHLATKGLSKGLLSAPAAIYAALLRNFSCAPQEARQMRRVISQEKLRNQLLPLPEVARRSAYVPVPETSLFFFYSCLPYQSNGYAMRSHGIAAELLHGSRRPLFYSRPGYPWDIKTSIPQVDYSNVKGVIYRHLRGNNIFVQDLEVALEKSAAIVEAVARTHRAAVLHAASNYVNALPVLMAARRLGVPFVYEVRGLWELTRASKVTYDWTQTDSYELDVRCETLVAQAADAVLPITEGLKAELASRGVDEAKMTVVPNGVNPLDFRPESPARNLAARLGLRPVPTIGFVGSFAPYEGLDDLVSAAKQLKDQGIDFNLLLVGDGDEFEKIKTQTAHLGMGDKVFFTGRVPHDEATAYYSLIDIAPFPRKPLKVCELVSPLKPFEAMAMGKTVLVSDVNAMTEFLLEGINGFSFQKGSVAHLTKQLGMLIASPELCARVGKNACRWVSEHRTWAQTARRIEAVHNALASIPNVVEHL